MHEPEIEPISYDRDFGGLFSKLPKEVCRPASVEELSRVLASYSVQDTPVTIRNTGHSANGQTLTDGVQIHLADLREITFDRDSMTVRAGAGCSWNTVMKTIGLPEFCTPVFPNNPRQEIHVGGTASVGGVGFFSSREGGVWNCIEAITLVTMKGDIIPCSRTSHPELFAFALGGYGRIGVIADVTFRVVKARRRLLGLGLGYLSEETLLSDVRKIMSAKDLCASVMVAHHPLLHVEELPMHLVPAVMGVVLDGDEDTLRTREQYLLRMLSETFSAFVELENVREDMYDMRVGQRRQLLDLADLVYWYPDRGTHGPGIANPWSDYGIPHQHYALFVKEARRAVSRHGIRKYLIEQRVNHFLSYHIDGGYVIRTAYRDDDSIPPLGRVQMQGE